MKIKLNQLPTLVNWQDKQYFGLLLLVFVWLLLVFMNFTPETWLSGWDNLHPEFNLGLNLKRVIFSVWQEYQGVGLLGGMGHAADLVRLLLIGILEVFLPTSLIRYALTFLALLFGSFGSYVLLVNLSSNYSKQSQLITATFGSLFYLLNIGTIQNFYVPFEPFVWFYAALPWLLLVVFRYLHTPRKSNLFWVAIVSFLASPLGYLQTNFLVYCMLLSVILLSYIGFSFIQKRKVPFTKIKNALLVLFVTLAVNAFWFTQVVYFTITDSQVTIDAKINQIATSEVSWSNYTYGSLSNVFTLKGYWFNLHDSNKLEQFSFLMEPWRNHLQSLPLQMITILFLLLMIIGIFQAFKKKTFTSISLILGLLMCILLLSGEHLPLGIINAVLEKTLPLFEQIFRSPFTKVIVPYSLLYSIFVGYGTSCLLSLFKKVDEKLVNLGIVSLLLFIGVYAMPVFFGNFFYSRVKVQIPQEYFSLFEYFETQPKNTRITFMPMQTFWGWNFYDWGYRGSGFLWYGIEQPILDRAFDVWSRYNESFYNEFSNALYRHDSPTMRRVLAKYSVSYVLIDENVQYIGENDDILYFDQIHQALEDMGAVKSWQEGSLHVYDLRSVASTESFISVPRQWNTSKTDFTYSSYDAAASNNFAYVHSKKMGVMYPFSEFNFEKTNNIYFADSKLLTSEKLKENNYLLSIPPVPAGSYFAPIADLEYTSEQVSIQFHSSGSIVIGEKTYLLPSLPSITIPVPEDFEAEKLIVSINDQPITIGINDTNTEPIRNLVVNEPIEILFFDSSKATTVNNQILVDAENIVRYQESNRIWQNFLQEQKAEVEGQEVTLLLPATNNHSYLDLLKQQTAINCDVLKRGMTKKSIQNNAIVYSANNAGALCEGVELMDVQTKHSHILNIDSTNHSGRNLKFFVNNLSTGHTDLEHLHKDENNDSLYVLFDKPTLTEHNNYTFNIDNRSFGTETSTNELANLTVTTLPFSNTWLSRIQLIPDNFTVSSGNVNIESVNKLAITHYQVNLNSSNGGLLAMKQGYDPGWIAYVNNNPLSLLKKYKYQSWSNAWHIPAEVNTVTLFYWPQLLQFAGIGLTLSTIIFILFALQIKNNIP